MMQSPPDAVGNVRCVIRWRFWKEIWERGESCHSLRRLCRREELSSPRASSPAGIPAQIPTETEVRCYRQRCSLQAGGFWGAPNCLPYKMKQDFLAERDEPGPDAIPNGGSK